MKKRLLIGLLFPLIVSAMENGLTIKLVGKELCITNILENEQKEPVDKMNLVHEKLVIYLQGKRDKGCNMSFFKGFASMLNDVVCEQLVQENKATDLNEYWSDGKKYEQSVVMKIYNK